jgi:hypothetical protein
MPMCHNLVEAMAVGTIPITNYPEWFDPDLRHMENCIVFDDRDDLIDKLHYALNITPDQLEFLRNNVISYYERHLKQQNFIHNIESRRDKVIPLLVYSERNVAQNHRKLNRNSILITGTSCTEEDHWIYRIPRRLLNLQ